MCYTSRYSSNTLEAKHISPSIRGKMSQAAYDCICLLTNLDHYRTQRPVISFHCGAEDKQVLAQGAVVFEADLRYRHMHSMDKIIGSM